MMSQAGRSAEVVAAASGGSNVRGVSATDADPFDLERPERAARLVEADEIQRVRLERRLEEVRPDGRLARRGAALVVRGRVVDVDDPPFGPGPRQEPDVLAKPLVARRLRQGVERAFDVLGEGRRQAALELLEAAARSGSYLSA